MDIIFLVIGLIGLYFGAEWLVSGSSRLALKAGISPLVIGLTVVALGTSAPELAVCLSLNFNGSPDAAIGNIIGSNIFNGMFVLPISALVHPLIVPKGGVVDIFMSLIFAALLIPVFIYGKALMNRQCGVIFVASYIGYMLFRVLSV